MKYDFILNYGDPDILICLNYGSIDYTRKHPKYDYVDLNYENIEKIFTNGKIYFNLLPTKCDIFFNLGDPILNSYIINKTDNNWLIYNKERDINFIYNINPYDITEVKYDYTDLNFDLLEEL